MSATCSLDGHVIQKDPRESFSTGNFMKIPHLIGFNSNEGYYFCDKLCPAFSKDNFTEEMAIKFLAQFLGMLYPGNEEKVAGMMNDMYFPPHEEDQRKDLGYLRMVCSCALGELFLTGPAWLAGELHSGKDVTSHFYIKMNNYNAVDLITLLWFKITGAL